MKALFIYFIILYLAIKRFKIHKQNKNAQKWTRQGKNLNNHLTSK